MCFSWLVFQFLLIALHSSRKWWAQVSSLRIIGPSYRGVWTCLAGFTDLQTPSVEIPWFLGFDFFLIFQAWGFCWLNLDLLMSFVWGIKSSRLESPRRWFLYAENVGNKMFQIWRAYNLSDAFDHQQTCTVYKMPKLIPPILIAVPYTYRWLVQPLTD